MNVFKRLKIGGELLLAVTVLFMIGVGIKMISLGGPTGVQLFLSAILFLVFMWLGWIQPKMTGIGLILLGLLLIIFFGNLAFDPDAWRLLGSPILVAGLLFLGAGWKSHNSI